MLGRLGRLKERYRQVAGQYDIAVERGSGQGRAAQLAEIEAAFRSLKGEAGLRPIFHVKPSRIRAHLFLAVLAYHGVHLLRKRLAQAGLRSSWETIRRQLAGWVRLTTSLRRPTAAGSSAARTPARTPKPQNWPRLSAWRRACIACAPATRPMPRRHRLPRNNPRP